MDVEALVNSFRIRMFHINSVNIGVAIDFGPRILYVAPEDKPEFNLFSILPDFGINTPDGFWRIYGGHRLWTSPEAMPRSYSLDNYPVSIEVREGSVIVSGSPEPGNSVLKSIALKPSFINGAVEVIHSIKNIGRWPIEFSCWALSVMRRGGFAIIPIKPRPIDERGLLPDRVISIWPYTRLTDERFILSNNYIFIIQDPSVERPFKIGVRANPPWTAYYVEGYAFVKIFKYERAVYPDFSVSVEVYTNNLFLELETVGPLRRVEPGEVNVHTEIWKVVKVGSLNPNEEDVVSKLEQKLPTALVEWSA
ncbi:MAG: hypothetical protein N3D82_01785 [Ignisphaera sp.]|nr:hypothetical protein [Ignisphaera sp.]MCX8167750.1 hypothetical protein [Ignisphaera sp.]MDW8086222.1 hypothetical protein [Ignisphaera sp.]